MLAKWYRWGKRGLLAAAALPLLQMTCDPSATLLQIGAGFANIVVTSTIQLFVQTAISTLVNTFPGSNILRALFVNAGFFPNVF